VRHLRSLEELSDNSVGGELIQVEFMSTIECSDYRTAAVVTLDSARILPSDTISAIASYNRLVSNLEGTLTSSPWALTEFCLRRLGLDCQDEVLPSSAAMVRSGQTMSFIGVRLIPPSRKISFPIWLYEFGMIHAWCPGDRDYLRFGENAKRR
jgi:hypothetical protein